MGNHRGVTDFFLHDLVTDYSANFLSRALVAVLFFPLFLLTWYENTVWFFIRGYVKDNPEKYYKWLDRKWRCARNIRPNLLFYPEGHRNLASTPLRLRTGIIRYAYSRKAPVQLFMAMGHEGVLNERTLETDLTPRLILYRVDTPITPQSFPDEASFLSHVETRFGELFQSVWAEYTARVPVQT